MNTHLVIHRIVQQTMVLIAQIATAGGVRAPLTKVANQVFLDLTNELAAQGLAKHVIADMFGMALRTYHRKVGATLASRTDGNRSVWEAVLEYIREHEPVSGAEVHERFRNDDAQVVTGVLADLTQSGLLYRSGRAMGAHYRIADAADFDNGTDGARGDAEQYLVWLLVFREGSLTSDAIAQALALPHERCRAALEQLVAEGRVTASEREGERYYQSRRFDVPLGNAHGWEAALLDHFQAMVAAICVKLRTGDARSDAADATGGGTYTFDIWPGHALEAEARSTLSRVRAMVIDLRDRIDAENARAGAGEEPRTPVVFYMGQYVAADEGRGMRS